MATRPPKKKSDAPINPFNWIKAIKASETEIARIWNDHHPDAYAGGSSHTNTKRQARDEFNIVYYCYTRNVKRLETKLLTTCALEGCKYNVRVRSNVSEGPGFVYVLVRMAA